MTTVRLKGFCPHCCSYGTCDCTEDEKLIREQEVVIVILRTALETIAGYRAGSTDAGMSPWTAQQALDELKPQQRSTD